VGWVEISFCGYFLCNSLRYSGTDLLNATVARGETCFCLLYYEIRSTSSSNEYLIFYGRPCL